MISEENRRKIFYFAKQLGLDEDARRTIQYSVTKRESLTEMTDFHAELVIQALKVELIKKNKEQSTKAGKWKNKLGHGDNVHNLMTPDQKDKIIAMSMQLYGSYSEASMDKFCTRQFHKKFKKLTSQEAVKLIEMQKKMLKRKIGRVS